MLKYRLHFILAGLITITVLLTGCTNERLEDELAYRQIGINSMQSGDYDGVIAAFNSALSQCAGKIGDTEIDICYYKAAAQYASGDMEGAMETYQALIDYDSKDGNAYYLRGCLYLEQGDGESAIADFDNAVKYNSQDYQLYVGIYENLSGSNMAEKGEEYLNKAFDIKGNTSENLTWRGNIYYLLGQYDNAKEELLAAIDKESAKANLYLAQTYEAEGDTESAEKYYQAYVASGAADSIAMNALAEIEMAKGNYTGALDYLAQGLSMETVTNQQDLLANQMIAYEYTGDFNAAWSIAQQYVALYPEDATAQREYIFLKNRQTTEDGSTGTTGEEESDTEAATQEGTETETASTEDTSKTDTQ